MRSCSPRRPMRWNAATGDIARCKATSIVYERKRRSVRALRWTCGVKPRPKGVDKPSYHSIMHGLDKPGVFTTVSQKAGVKLSDTASHLRHILANTVSETHRAHAVASARQRTEAAAHCAMSRMQAPAQLIWLRGGF